MKREALTNGYVYHVFTKSIAGYQVFKYDQDYLRIVNLIKYHRLERPPTKFSTYMALKDKVSFFDKYCSGKEYLIDVVAYRIMPTHLQTPVFGIGGSKIPPPSGWKTHASAHN